MNSPESRIKPGIFRLGFVAGFIFVLYSQKQRYCFCSGAVFCHWAERLGNEVRPQARLRCVSWGERAPVALCREPTEAAAETSPSLDFLLAFRVFSSGFTRSQSFPSPPAPKTHPVSPFSAQTGCVFLFFAVFWPQNIRAVFCASCRIVLTS